MNLWNFIMIYEALILILVSSQPFDLWSFIPDLGLFSTTCQLEIYIITFIAIVNNNQKLNQTYKTTLNYSFLNNNSLSNNRK